MSALSCSTWRLIRPATRSTNGDLVCKPGPPTRTNLPNRSTIARSCCWTVKKKIGIARNVSTFRHVAQEFEPRAPLRGADQESLLGRIADPSLLEAETPLPAALGRPAPYVPTQRRRWIVGVGATLTGATLIGGLALIAAGGG